MRDFCGSMAGQLPRKHGNVFCFQYVRPWQWQVVAGLCHARNLLKEKRKNRVVADAWQPSIYDYYAALCHSAQAFDYCGQTQKFLRVKNKQRPRSGASWRTGREDDHDSWLTEGVGVRTLCPHHMSERTLTQENCHAQGTRL